MRLLWLLLLTAGSSFGATTYYVTISGLGGESAYEQRFRGWAEEIEKLLKSGDPEGKFETLSGPAATKTKVQSVFRQIAQTATAQDALVVTLIGHGTFDGSDYKLTLPGADITAVELAALLDRIPAQRQLIVNTTSASGGSILTLRKPNRAIVSATRTGTEKNATNFARYWVEALRDPSADTDKNEVITTSEAFRYAEQKTKAFFEEQKRIATEHAVLDDGTGTGKELTAMAAPARYPLLRIGAIQQAARNPAKQKLLAQREGVEKKIEELKYKKASMPDEEYKRQMTEALIELAKVQQEIDQ